jgi:hypothetical protein
MVHLKESGIEVWVGLGNKSTKGRKAKEYDVTTTQENNVVTTTCGKSLSGSLFPILALMAATTFTPLRSSETFHITQ